MSAVRAILTILVAFTPLALVTGIFRSHDVIPKVILILAGAALLLFLLPRWAGHLATLWQRSEGRLFLMLAIAQFASLLLSTVFSTQPALSFAGTLWRRFGLVEQAATLVIATALACAALARPGWSQSLFRAMAVCGGAASLYGIAQYFGVDPILSRNLYAIEFLAGVVRPPATMGHAIYFSAYLVPVALIAASCAWKEADVRWKLLHAAVASLACLAIILSGTRASVLAVAAGGLLLGWRIWLAGTSKAALKLAAGAVATLALAAAVGASSAGADLRHRLVQWRQDPGGTRMGVWADSPALIREHPLLGTGLETFAAEFRRIQSAALSRAYPDFYHETPHNAFIDAASGQGIPGLLILAGVFAFGWKRRAVDAGLEAALLGMLIGSLFASWTLVSSLYLWSIAGLLAALPDRAAPTRDSIPWTFLWRIPARLAGAAFVVVAILLAIQDAAYARLGDAVSAKDFAAANMAWESAISVSLGLPGYELWSSREMATLGRSLGNTPQGARAWRTATEAAALAESRSEEPFSAAYQSSVLAVAAGDLTRAESKARDGIELAPNWYKPHLLLAQILEIMGRKDEAAEQAQISAQLGWKRP
jgi:O-antigen ligase